MNGSRGKPFRSVFLSLASLLFLGATFASLEIYFRRYHPPQAWTEKSVDYLQFCRAMSRPFFRKTLTPRGWVLRQVSNHHYFPFPQTLALRKAAGARRIVVLGESSGRSVAMKLRRLFKEEGAAGFEVVECAVAGSGLANLEQNFNEALGCEPDIILIVFGNNLAHGFPRLGAIDYLAARIVRSSAFLSTFLSHRVVFDERPTSARLTEWDGFLRRAARETAARGLPLVVFTLQSNLRNPEAAQPGELEDPAYLAAAAEADAGRKGAAVAILAPAAESRRSRFWLYRVGEWELELGRAKAARAHLIAARDLDDFRTQDTHVLSEMTELTRRTAAEERVTLADLAGLIDERAVDRVPGFDMFGDVCHLNDTWNPLYALSAVEAFRRLGWPSPGFDWQPFIEREEREIAEKNKKARPPEAAGLH